MVTVPPFVKNPLFGAAVCCAVILYSGAVTPKVRHPFISLLQPDSITELTGEIVSNPVKTSRYGSSYQCSFSVFNARARSGLSSSCRGTVTVYLPASAVESLYPGKLFTAVKSGHLFAAETGARTTLSVAFMPQKNKTDANKSAPPSYTVTSASSSSWSPGLKGIVDRFRAVCRLSFRRILSAWGAAGGLILALLAGSRDYTEKVLADSFKRAGLAHLLALSGMHLSLFSGLAVFVGKKAASEKIAQGLKLASILFFVWFAGLSPSLFRALLCSLIMFGMNVLRMKKLDAVNVLGIAFLVHTVIFPADVTSAAFMLSYGALAGILMLSPRISSLFSRRFFPHLSSALSDSCSAQIFTAPVTASLFGTLTPAGIPAAVVVNPLITIFIYAGLAGICLSLCLPFLSPAVSAIMQILYEVVKKSVMLFGSFPSISI